MQSLSSIDLDKLREIFEKEKYVAEDDIILSVFLSIRLNKPLLIEGEPGCGKTEIAKVLSYGLNTELIRLQCYEGLTANEAIYEWDYLRQLIAIKMAEGMKNIPENFNVFSERFILKRPLLKAVLHEGEKPPVLLIDEIDRADEEFEGFLLEFLAEFQVTIPEIGTFKAKNPPLVIITSNRTREIGDGLRRRCLYLYIPYPSFEKEYKIVKLKVEGIKENLASQIVMFVSKLRNIDSIIKKPGVAETLDFARALNEMKVENLDPNSARKAIGAIAKTPDDFFFINNNLERLLNEAIK